MALNMSFVMRRIRVTLQSSGILPPGVSPGESEWPAPLE